MTTTKHKAWIAAVGAALVDGLHLTYALLDDGQISGREGVEIALTVLVSGLFAYGVFKVPNKPVVETRPSREYLGR